MVPAVPSPDAGTSGAWDDVMIRSARGSDLAAIAGLYHDVWHATHGPAMPVEERARRTPEFFHQRVAALLGTTLVLAGDQRVLAFASTAGPRLVLLYSDPSVRAIGLTSKLLNAAEEAMSGVHVTEAWLTCLAENGRARSFYMRNGWRDDREVDIQVLGSAGPEARTFIRMTKTLR